MQLNHLLKNISIIESKFNHNPNISSISYHTNTVANNHLFVCIKGFKTDGHKFLADAVEKGAVAAIVEEINEGIQIPQFKVDNSRKALAILSHYFYGQPSKDMKMIGVTATNGKTTTSYMMNSIFENHGYTTGLVGSVNVKMGDDYTPSRLTTPESLDLHRYFNEMRKLHTSHVIMEVSSAAQEMHRVEGIKYDIVTLNNINKEHIETHGSFERYVDVKTRLIKNAEENSIAILNIDCLEARQLLNQTKAKTITFGVNDTSGDISIRDLDLSTGRANFTVIINKQINLPDISIYPTTFKIELGIPGLHSVSNSLIAMITSLIYNIPITTIQETLKSFTGVERRFQFIHEQEVTIIDDHFANSGNIDVTLETIFMMNFNHFHLLYAVRGQRGPTVNRENAETVVKWAKKLDIKKITVTKSSSHVTEYDKVTEEETKAFIDVMESANIEVHLFNELDDAIYEILADLSHKDLVLLAGCQGMDDGANIALNNLNLIKI